MKDINRLYGLAAAATLAVLLAAPARLAAQAPPAGATFKCADGTYSTAATARGACSRHGGVAQALRAAPPSAARRAPAAAPEAAPAPERGARTAPPAGAKFKCADGTYSTAATPRGACSRHGGVAETLGTAAAAPAAPAAPPTAAPRAAPRTSAAPAGAPANATALCKDGTYSTSQHRGGTCSRHGGVDRWLREVPN